MAKSLACLVDAVHGIAVKSGLNIVSIGLDTVVGDPAVVVELKRRFVADPCNHGPRDGRTLHSVRRGRAGCKWKRVVGDIDHRVRIYINAVSWLAAI